MFHDSLREWSKFFEQRIFFDGRGGSHQPGFSIDICFKTNLVVSQMFYVHPFFRGVLGENDPI